MKSEKIVLIGAGNLGTHIGRALKNAGHSVLQVYSRTDNSAQKLANELDCNFITSINQISDKANLILLAVPENVIPEILSQLKTSEHKLVLHTSGSLEMDICKHFANNYGVLYPMQTFSKFRKINFFEVPVFIEANTKENLKRTLELAQTISGNVNVTDSSQRRIMHISAVFMNNFVNHFYSLGNQIASDNGCRFGFEIFKPLIHETTLKVLESGNPSECQTGPALRGSSGVIQLHSDLLKYNTDYQKLYTFVSESIGKYYKTGV